MSTKFELLSEKHFPLLEEWFDDESTRRYLGGRDWLYRAVDLMQNVVGSEFRGATVTGRYVWVVWKDEVPVALFDVEPYDDGSASFAFVVAPKWRGAGIGPEVLALLDERVELTGVHTLSGGVEPDNLASRRCLEKAGFAIATEPDEEDMLEATRTLTASSSSSQRPVSLYT